MKRSVASKILGIISSSDHPFFVGLQAHPEFCTRPLNPSPPFLGFIAAACGTSVLKEQIDSQLATFKSPHPISSMIPDSERSLSSEEHLTKGNSSDPKKKEAGEQSKDTQISKLQERIMQLESTIKELQDEKDRNAKIDLDLNGHAH